MVVAESLGIKSRRMDTYLKELTGTKKIKKVTHGTYEKSTPATLQYVQFEAEEADFQQDEPQISLGNDLLCDKIESIESEFSQSEFVEGDIAQIAKLQDPLFEESVGDDYENVTDKLLQFEWLNELQKHTEYDREAINRILQNSGYETYMKRLSQITLAIQQGKLIEIVEGWYELPHHGFDSHSNL
jgi:hypothetical protein